MDRPTAQRLIAQGYVAIVYVAYSYADKHRGDIISKHKTYEAADRAAGKNARWSVRILAHVT